MLEKIYMRHKNDCMTCCLAMVLGLKHEDVPRFFDDNNVPIGDGYFCEVEKFLVARGFQLITITADESICNLKGYVIAAGPSYNPEFQKLGVWHAVVYKDGELWCDPKGENPPGAIVPEHIDLIVPIFK